MNFLEDIKGGLLRKRLWIELAKLDLKANYQGSALGVFWIVLALMLKVGMLSVVYSMVLDKNFGDYILFLALGILTWNFISSIITNGATIFRKASNFMQQMRLEHSTFVFQNVYKECLVLLMYQLFAIPLVFFIKGTEILSWMWFWVIFGYLLIILIAFFASFWIGWLSARFRDIQPMLGSLVVILFLITPVLWPPPEKFADSLYFQLNPFFHLLELIRAPIVQGEVPVTSIWVAVFLLTLNMLICLIFYSKVRDRLVLWL